VVIEGGPAVVELSAPSSLWFRVVTGDRVVTVTSTGIRDDDVGKGGTAKTWVTVTVTGTLLGQPAGV